MEIFTVKPIKDLLLMDIDNLIQESKEDGFRFVERLFQEYREGTNTFNKLGESLYGVFTNAGAIVAIGGLNIDPFSTQNKIGRVRRFYVSKYYRRNGLGKLLLDRIVEDAKNHFNILVLHTDTNRASQFYTSSGFSKDDQHPNSTHCLVLK
jgi:GNAT superfamily N-acetyltransferase